jgi:hypothetical protein
MAKGFAVRGLEVHSSRMYDFTQMQNTIAFMEKYGLNTLIFHQNDLADVLVFPEKYFPMEYMWKRFPPRYSRVLNFRYYIRNIIRMCHRRGIQFMLETKELWYDEWILELRPEVINPDTGMICPSHPFWFEYLTEKLKELFTEVPGIDGIIVSPGTRESKLSITANRCGCDRCSSMKDEEWFAHLISTMHAVMNPLQKKLVVRDFAFGERDQTVVLQGVNCAGVDVTMSLKNTPHDFYPTFPTNPAIGHSGHPEWVEFDTWGQFIGNGVFPVSIIEDMQCRMRDSFASGAEGIFLRTDWENMQDACVFNSPNLVNLIAGAKYAQDVDTPCEDIYRAWAEYGLVNPMLPASADPKPEPLKNTDDYVYLRDFMRASWKVVEKTMFVRGHLFQDNSMAPYSMERGSEIMMKAHCMDEWLPGASQQVLPTSENLKIIFEEKAQAVREAEALRDILQIEKLGFSDELVAGFNELLDLYPYYVRCYEYSCKAYFLCLLAEKTRKAADRCKVEAALEQLTDYAAVVRERLEQGEYYHEIPRLMAYDRLLSLKSSILSHLEAIQDWS